MGWLMSSLLVMGYQRAKPLGSSASRLMGVTGQPFNGLHASWPTCPPASWHKGTEIQGADLPGVCGCRVQKPVLRVSLCSRRPKRLRTVCSVCMRVCGLFLSVCVSVGYGGLGWVETGLAGGEGVVGVILRGEGYSCLGLGFGWVSGCETGGMNH